MTDTTPTPADRPADQLRARLRAAAQRALESLDNLIADHQDPGAEALGARYELARELSNTHPEVARQLLGTSMGEGADALFPDEGADELRAELAKLIRWHKEDGDQLAKMRGTIERLRAERTELIRQRDQIAMDTIKALPAPADRAAVLAEAADFVRGLLVSRPGITTAGVEAELRRLAGDAAAGVQPPTTITRYTVSALPAVPADGTRCTCGGRFPTFHLHADTHEPAAPAAPEETQ